MDDFSVTGYTMKIEKMRNGNFDEFYEIPCKSSNLNMFKVRGLLKKKKWSKLEIRNSVKAVFLRRKKKFTQRIDYFPITSVFSVVVLKINFLFPQ